MIISTVAIKRSTTVLAFVLLVVLFGTYSYLTLPREAAPDVEVPYVFVTTTDPGVAPEDVESAITVPLESKLKGISDVKEIRSESRQGTSLISIEFLPSLKIEDALQKVRDKVDQAKSDLPDDADEPIISELNIAEFPIMFINVSGDVGLDQLKEIADDLQDDIESIEGVLSADVIGGLEREVRVELDPDRLASYELPYPRLMSVVYDENANVSGGTVDIATGQYQIRVPAEFNNPMELESLSIRADGGGPIYLKDIGRIVDTHKDRTSYARFNGKETVTIQVRKRIGENAVRIANQIKQLLAQWKGRFPEHVTAAVTLDMSDFIRKTVEDLENNILTALIFVVGVIFIFLGVRNALFVALAIPLSMLLTFGVLLLAGVTLNMVVLFSLILALGMLVDNAIVIVENIYRHLQEGVPRVEAALHGAAEVAWPVITSTFTTVAAFVPILFWPGLIGKFMRFLPMTVIIALLSSLLVALVVNPTLCSKAMRARSRRRAGQQEQQWHPIQRAYATFLRCALRHPGISIFLPCLCLVLVVVAYVNYGRGVVFFPDVEPRSARVNIVAPQGTNIETTNKLALQVEQVVRGLPDIKYYVASVGAGGGSMFGFGSSGSNVATVAVEFVDRRERKQSSEATIDQFRNKLKDFVGAEVHVEEEKHGPPTGPPVNVEISGKDFRTLGALAHQVKHIVRQVPGVVDLKDDFVETRPELQFHVDRDRATLLGLNTRYVANFLKMAVQGTQVDTFWEDNEEYDITVRLAEPYRSNPLRLSELLIPDLQGNRVPLSSVARSELGSGLGAITRVDQERVITVSSNVAKGYLPTKVLKAVQQRLEGFPLPRGYNISFTGESEDMQDSQGFLSLAFAVAIMLVLLILISQFNSATVPAIVMFTVVLSLTGVLLGLVLTGTAFGVVMTGIGVISLAGVVVNNGIVLLDYIEKLLRRGLDIETALVQGGVARLRPVMLTAITTILGLLPMAVGVSINFRAMLSRLGILHGIHQPIIDIGSENAQWWGQMAVAVIFGLAFATILTLVVVPTLYLLSYRLRKAFGKEIKAEG